MAMERTALSGLAALDALRAARRSHNRRLKLCMAWQAHDVRLPPNLRETARRSWLQRCLRKRRPSGGWGKKR